MERVVDARARCLARQDSRDDQVAIEANGTNAASNTPRHTVIEGSGGENDQWVKADVGLSRCAWLSTDRWLNCGFRAVLERDNPIAAQLLIAGTPEPTPLVSFEPGDKVEVQVAIWVPQNHVSSQDMVDMSRSLSFRL